MTEIIIHQNNTAVNYYSSIVFALNHSWNPIKLLGELFRMISQDIGNATGQLLSHLDMEELVRTMSV